MKQISKIASKFKLAIIQNKVSKQKAETLNYINEALQQAVANQAQVCVFGETFNSLYNKEYLTQTAENFSSDSTPTLTLLKNFAKKHQIYIFGSIPESANDNIKQQQKLFNTAIAINQQGNLLAAHRKVHLFDIDIPGKFTYKESDTFKAGDRATVIETSFGKVGLAICYDIRFAELGLLMARRGAKLLIYPGSFSMATGPMHWEILLRGRAIDNLCYVVGSCAARYVEDSKVFQAWGHSTLVDPFGQIKITTGHESTILYQDVDLNYVDQVREQIPIYKQKRYDIYDIVDKKN